MPAKLDTSKPLRLIGIQIYEGTHENVRKVLTPGWYPFIKCKNDDEMGTSKTTYPVVADDGCPQDYYWIDQKRLPRISISAIAGKNGSGKSSLVEILYRMLNNFAKELLQVEEGVDTGEVEQVYGLEARLYFEQDGVQKFINLDDGPVTYFEVVDGQLEQIKINLLTERQRYDVLNGFFYTICVNYSLYAFNPADFLSPFAKRNDDTDDGNWLSYLFHKNDGYYIPLVLTPFRENGQIDVNNENELAKQRIEVLSLMFHSQGKEFLDEYVPKTYSYRFNPNYKEQKQSKLHIKPIKSEIENSQITLINDIEPLWESLLQKELSIVIDPTDSKRDEIVLFYLAYKTLKICATYPVYREKSNFDKLMEAKEPTMVEVNGRKSTVLNEDGTVKMTVKPSVVEEWFENNKENIAAIIKEIYDSQENHITVKIHQCLDYLREMRYQVDEAQLDVDKDLLHGVSYDSYDRMMRLLPPTFFITEVSYRKKRRKNQKIDKREITLQSMSSGERQMLYSLSYIFYHIKNIASIKEDGKRVVGYHHVNLIFDEAELYYHPEYQRQYITRLLEHLAMCNINRTNIRSINIMIITHSPFILSDLPETNILFLRKGDDEKEDVPQKTLGANIYDLLKSGFFLDYAIGDVAQRKLKEIMDVYYEDDGEIQKNAFENRKKEFKFTIEHLGEDYLRRNFMHMYEELERKTVGVSRKEQLAARINSLQEEMDSLKAEMEEA